MPFNMIGGLFSSGINAISQNAQNNKNIAFQREQNEITRGREDNAIQRQMADAELAGVNPFALAGSSGASAATMNAPQGQAPQVDIDTSGIMAGIAKMGEFKKSQAEIDFINAQTGKTIGETNQTAKAVAFTDAKNLNPKDTSTPTASNQVQRELLDKIVEKGREHNNNNSPSQQKDTFLMFEKDKDKGWSSATLKKKYQNSGGIR